MSKPTIIISGFPGVGKSYFYDQHRVNPDFQAIDSDSSLFNPKSAVDEEDRLKKISWPVNYMNHIKENIGRVDVIFVSSHREVRNALVAEGLKFILCYPSVEMKEKYVQRYRDRGDCEGFVQMLDDNWEAWLTECREFKGGHHVELIGGGLTNYWDFIVALRVVNYAKE